MEIPVVNRISDFEARITGIQNLSQPYTFWKWGALIIALLASFPTIITKINLFITGFRRFRSLRSDPRSQNLIQDHDDYSDYTDDDDTCSVSSSSSLSDSEQSSNHHAPSIAMDQNFNVRGSAHYGHDRGHDRNLRLRRRRSFGGYHRFSWSDFANGNSVVKLWDSLALGLDLDHDDHSERLVSVYDMDKQKKITSFCGWPATATSSPSTVLSADTNVSGRVSLGVWDTRVGGGIPAILAEWGPQLGRIVGVASGGVEKVYVKDGVTGALTFGDVRKVGSPLRKGTDADVDDTWWDADAVIVSDDCFDESEVSGCDSAVTRCCSAVKSYLF